MTIQPAVAGSARRTRMMPGWPGHVRMVMASVAQVVAGATSLLLGDPAVDPAELARWQATVRDQVADATARALQTLEHPAIGPVDRRRVVTMILVLSDLERCADAAADITRQAESGLRERMTPKALGMIGRFAEVHAERWDGLAVACGRRQVPSRLLGDSTGGVCDRLAVEVARGSMDRVTRIQARMVVDAFDRLRTHTTRIARRIDAINDRGNRSHRVVQTELREA